MKHALRPKLNQTSIAIAAFACSVCVHAADWSDTSIGYRYGTQFAEPVNANAIAKDIINLNHVSGYKYGSNFFNADLLMSDDKDPGGKNATSGAQEVYVVYRHTLDLGKVTGSSYAMGPVRGVGLVGGFDWNTKNDAGYNSKKRMLVAGPSLMLDVPGFLNVALLGLWESNAPFSTITSVSVPRYNYSPHPMVSLTWGVPLAFTNMPLAFEGFANFIASKGKNEYGSDTAAPGPKPCVWEWSTNTGTTSLVTTTAIPTTRAEPWPTRGWHALNTTSNSTAAARERRGVFAHPAAALTVGSKAWPCQLRPIWP